MELTLSLGDNGKKPIKITNQISSNKDLALCIANDSETFTGGEEEEEEEEAVASMSLSPPDSETSSFRLEFGVKRYRRNKKDEEDEDCNENGFTRKKLRLSKDQSAFLEDSFKEHTTLNPKQKIALAKELNLRPRQVEVWFQNRRARTKLKQTEVDCEYLNKCCESLTEENRRLQKEVKELRALKTLNPFCMQLPATTLTMCPSCERVATSSVPPSSSVSSLATTASHNLGLSTSSLHNPALTQAKQAS